MTPPQDIPELSGSEISDSDITDSDASTEELDTKQAEIDSKTKDNDLDTNTADITEPETTGSENSNIPEPQNTNSEPKDLLTQALNNELDIGLELSPTISFLTHCFLGAVASAFGGLCAALMARAEYLLLGLPYKHALTAHFWLFLGMGAGNWFLWKHYSKALEMTDFWRSTLTTIGITLVLAGVTGYTVLNDCLVMLPYSIGLCITASLAPGGYEMWKRVKAWWQDKAKVE